MEELERMKPKNAKAKLELLGKYDPEGEIIIRDPYYVRIYFDNFFFLNSFFVNEFLLLMFFFLQDSGREGFVKAFEQCTRSVAAFFNEHK